jgi:hypothetical protein
MNLEINIILINLIVLVTAYGLIYPFFFKNDFFQIIIQDGIALAITLFIVGSVYFKSGQLFNLFFMKISWFWFTLITFVLLELAFFTYYTKKSKVEW